MLEYDGSTGAPLRWYAYGLGPNDVLGQMNIPANTRTTPVPDLLGSIVASMDAGTGALTKFAYRPYGASVTPPTPFGFTGQRIDPEAGGIYYYRARAYSPGFGRFLQPDPTGYSAGANLYAYVSNDPLNLIDPEGLSAYSAIVGTLQTMVDPYVSFYQRSIVEPFYGGLNAIAQSPVGDPGLYASLQGLGPPGALAGGAGYLAASGLGAIARFGTGVTGPIAGGGAALENLSVGNIARIQNAADRAGIEISVVGSRAAGTTGPVSDFDYILQGGTSSARKSVKSSLPSGPRGLGEPRNQDFLPGPIDPTKPYITFFLGRSDE